MTEQEKLLRDIGKILDNFDIYPIGNTVKKDQKISGFGLLGIIILATVIASVTFGGGMYWNETKKQQSFLETGADAKKRVEELKKQIESRPLPQ